MLKKVKDDIFLKQYPTIDVHGETRDTVLLVMKEFINDNIKLGNNKIVVIHGRGRGILKDAIHNELKKNKQVSKYYLDNWNIGCTIIELIVDNK